MNKKERIERINCVLKEYFCQNPNAGTIPAKDFMPLFIEAGIFNKDEKNGLPIRRLLRELDDSKELSSIPFVIKQQKAINRNWFYCCPLNFAWFRGRVRMRKIWADSHTRFSPFGYLCSFQTLTITKSWAKVHIFF